MNNNSSIVAEPRQVSSIDSFFSNNLIAFSSFYFDSQNHWIIVIIHVLYFFYVLLLFTACVAIDVSLIHLTPLVPLSIERSSSLNNWYILCSGSQKSILYHQQYLVFISYCTGPFGPTIDKSELHGDFSLGIFLSSLLQAWKVFFIYYYSSLTLLIVSPSKRWQKNQSMDKVTTNRFRNSQNIMRMSKRIARILN